VKRNKAAEAALQAALALIEQARDQGRDYFKQSPNEMLVEVSRYASVMFSENHHVIAFLQGYSQARIAHDAWQEGE